ncbi:hypothetical protein V1498_20790 [Peribacillus sp. SCS-26]|uniref:hypothetical protein n=1 Tax=Paraperibacillus marinus TaxID=3115295 RepID=UPI003906219F
MSKKKAIKLATATAIAASAFAAVAPVSQAATSVDAQIKKAIDASNKQQLKAFNAYYQAGLAGLTPPASVVQKEIDAAKKLHATAYNLIKAKGGKNKTAYYTLLKKEDSKVKYAVSYVKAMYAAAAVKKQAVAFDAAENETNKALLQSKIAAFKSVVATIYGYTERNLLLKNYAAPAEAKLKAYLATAQVTNVAVSSAKTLTISGLYLNNLKAADVTVEGNSVSSVTASADGKSATVTLGSNLGLNREYNVTVAGKEYKLAFGFAVSSVSVFTTQVDDDAAGQEIKFNVNGAPADLDFLKNVAGYSVEFQADKSIFTGNSLTSATGEIDAADVDVVNNGSFNVKVVLTKGGEVYSSAWQNIQVKNFNDTPPIGSIVLTNDAKTTATGDDFDMNSSTIVVGETAKVTDVLSNSGDSIFATGGFEYSSSNVGVATVSTSGVITPVAPGTTTLTIKSGLQTYTKTITVSGAARTVSKLTPAKSSYNVVKGATVNVAVSAKDQYGDPIAVATGDAVVAEASSLATADAAELVVGANGNGSISFAAGTDTGTFPVYLKVDGATLAQFDVVVTGESVVASTKIESTRSALDLGSAALKSTKVKVNQYTTSGGYVKTLDGTPVANAATATLEGYTLSVQDSRVADLTVVSGDVENVVVTGKITGSTKLVLKNANGIDVAYFDVTVSDTTVSVSDITWKNPGVLSTVGKVVTPRDVLTITNVAGDDIVSGVGLTKTTSSKVRINEFTSGGSTAENTLYLDVNDDADFTTGVDVVLGTVAVSKDPQFAGAALNTVAASTAANVWFNTTSPAYGVLDRALAAGDKGNLIFTFTKRGATVPATSTVVSVETK